MGPLFIILSAITPSLSPRVLLWADYLRARDSFVRQMELNFEDPPPEALALAPYFGLFHSLVEPPR